MAKWSYTNSRKRIVIRDVQGVSPPMGCSGVSVQTGGFDFTAWDLAVATAFCANRSHIPPKDRRAHARSISGMIDLHVDPKTGDFAINVSADRLKDFVGSYLTGVVATGLAFLYMHRQGYVWFGHFEDANPGNTRTRKAPDFVFQHRVTRELALVESKGTRQRTGRAFARKGYIEQVTPHLGYKAFGQVVTYGYCIGSRLPPVKGDLVVFHTKPALAPVSGRPVRRPPPIIPPGRGPTQIQRATFDRSMELVFGVPPWVDVDDEPGATPPIGMIPSSLRRTVRWAGREWIVAPTWRWTPADDDRLSTAFMVGGLRVDSLLGLDLSEPPIPGAIWAFDKHVFDAFNEVGEGDRRAPEPYCLDSDTLTDLQRQTEDGGGSVIASGLALLPMRRLEPVPEPSR